MTKTANKILRLLCILLCVLQCLPGCRAGRAAGKAANDKYRTTYEIFVGSFCDSDQDGTGDLNGIRSKLDYIEDLGFDAIWLTPVHPSSTYHKYDVDDYYAVDPAFGTMDDFEDLLEDCHKRGISVYMDLVLNHTSEDHEWFRAASDYLHELPEGWEPDASYCRYYDYYNFSREPADGFAWFEGTDWYYEAGFWSEMPDLNLSSEAVREEIRGIMSYWLGKGVDGFRLDAVMSYYEGDTAANEEFLSFLTGTARGIDPDCYLVGEAWTDRDTISALYGSGIDSLFEFPYAGRDGIIANTLNGLCPPSYYVSSMVQTETANAKSDPDFIEAPFYTNHDMDRSAEYYPDDSGAVTKMAYAMNLLMPGNAFVYYGEELGMCGTGRDENRRAPMYWSDDAADPDMCAGPPGMDEVWMKYPSLADQKGDDSSIYNWFKEVIRVRNEYPAIACGVTGEASFLCDDKTAAFFRKGGAGDDLLIVMNLSPQAVEKDLSKQIKGFRLAESLETSGESITYKGRILRMPAYSIAVFTAK